jgi:hypothetical protein
VKIKSKDDMKVGVVVWFLPDGQMKPPKAQLDQYAIVRRHPFVCTYYDSVSGASQWLFLTSDQYRADSGCVFKVTDKDGTLPDWLTKDSYFVRNNCVEIAEVKDVISLSADDSFAMPALVKEEVLNKFGGDVLKKKEDK